MILELCARVETSVDSSVRSLMQCDVELAKQVIDADTVIDSKEIEVEEECLKILALHQPVAIDLRIIVGILKINNDLERIGDLAVSIARRSFLIKKHEGEDTVLDFSRMVARVQSMLKKSLDAFVNLDPEMARDVCLEDDEVDDMNREIFDHVKNKIRKKPEEIGTWIHHVSVSRNLERIADHATNIAEDVIYMITGEIVRHHPKE
jgi:phosphate transport system protein